MARLKRFMSLAHKMKTTRAAFVVGMAMAGGLILFLLKDRHPPQGWAATRDAFKVTLVPRGLYNGDSNKDGGTSLVDEIVAIQNETSALRGHLSASHSPMTSPSLKSVVGPALHEFQRAVTDDERRIFVDLLRVIDDVTTRHDIPYFMTYGTMLGSFRHHDMTPWDDDADVAMPYNQKGVVWKLLSDLGERGYIVKSTADTQYRFFGPESRLYSPTWPWQWPYVDIDFYKVNKTHILLHGAGTDYWYRKAVIFPVHRRPLGSVFLNAPRDGLKYLKLTYKDYNFCLTGMEHKIGRYRIRATVPCSIFGETYPFVHRSLTWDGKVVEMLKLGSKVLYSLTVDEPIESASINPFTLANVEVSVHGSE